MTKLHPLIQVVAREPIRIDAGAGRFEFDVADDQATPDHAVVGPGTPDRAGNLPREHELRMSKILRARFNQHFDRPTQMILQRNPIVRASRCSYPQAKICVEALNRPMSRRD